ncbi:hypothetical protein OE88DRAFT_1651951 [Heliocybe sulcata]|uniref:Peroxisomal membrane protein PEX14 n=1 Tax=Heliocybe sulcata TaxID=5364 RepID=A0A5C3NGG9_9AGAM|nr:hypothetical protein OE88DRAFT_1651951 [Heliocybe sulcata]
MSGEDAQAPVADATTHGASAPDAGPQTAPEANATSLSAPAPEDDRRELLDRARSFLLSPQVRDEDIWAKRTFLAEKGLTDPEIDGLLRELPSRAQVPQVPPRTYPQPPPSRLPDLLAGIMRITGWIAGGSAVLLLIYSRFILPRLARSYSSRHALITHQKSLLARLTASLASLKEAQSSAYSDLPRPDPFREPPEYRVCRTIDDILAVCEDKEKIDEVPEYSLVRCAIGELEREGKDVTTGALFERLRAKIGWLETAEGIVYQERLWHTLTTASPFTPSNPSNPSSSTWTYTPPTPPPPSALLTSLSTLHSSLPQPVPAPRYQHTQQALADFTGYLTTRAYASPTFLKGSGYGIGGAAEDGGTKVEEEVKREIKALKGLVLNRRSFMSSLHRQPSQPALPVPPTPGG